MPTTEPDAREGWHPEDIKAAIRKRGMTLSKLSTDNRLEESSCRQALVRPHGSAERVISAYLGVPLHELWPDRWDADGGRIRHVRDQDKHDRDGNHGLSGEAA